MKYIEFDFENFRGIKKTNIKLGDGLHSFVGINESGKTTILKAILQTYELLLGKNLNGNFEKIRPKISSFTGNIKMSVVIELSEKDLNQAIFKNKLIGKTITYTFSYKCVRGALAEDWKNDYKTIEGFIKKLTPSEKEKLDEYVKKNAQPVLLYDHFLDENPSVIVFYTKNSDPSEIAQDKSFHDGINTKWIDILNDIGRESYDHFHSIQSDIVDWKDEHPNSTDDLNRLSDINTKITKTIKEHWDKLYSKKSIKEIKIDRRIEKSLTGKSTRYIFEVIVFGTDNKPYKVEERSLGFKWFFSFLLFTKFRQNRNLNTLFLIDEPASNLYASSQESVLQALDDLASNSCVIYTTHSPYLYSGQYLGQSYLIRNNDTEKEVVESDIKAYKLTDIDFNDKKIQEYMRTVLDSYKLKLHTIQLGDKNCFIEGFEDWAFINLFVRICFKKLQDMVLVHGRGASSMSPEISSARCHNKQFIVILDDDQGGTDALKYYKNNFKMIPIEDKIKTLFKIDNKLKEIQSILSEEDKKLLLNLADMQDVQITKSSITKALISLNETCLFGRDLNKKTKIVNEINENLSRSAKDSIEKIISFLEGYFI